MTRTKLLGCRDALGIRPLVLGRLGTAWVLASETCALDIVGADLVREVAPGEMVVITAEGGVESHFPFRPRRPRFCIFEHVYFSRPDSLIGGRSVYETREAIGRELAREAPVEADLVCPVPDSGTPAAIGFAAESGIPFGMGIIRNQYVGRTFIEPTDQIRNMGVRLKLNVNRALIRGKRVVLVDDSVVRGTTSRKIKEMILDAGAREVHFRIASPPPPGPASMAWTRPSARSSWRRRCPRRRSPASGGAFAALHLARRALSRRRRGRRARSGQPPLLRCLLLGGLSGGTGRHDRGRVPPEGGRAGLSRFPSATPRRKGGPCRARLRADAAPQQEGGSPPAPRCDRPRRPPVEETDPMDESTLRPLRPRIRPRDLPQAAPEGAMADAPTEPLRPVARSDGPVAVPPEVAEAATQPDALDPDRLALIGLFHSPGASAALVRLASGQILRVETGQVVAGAVVSAIGPDSLRLQRGGRETILTIAG
ncbi:Glutamine phosphoribosylpyrophosphate amidotransferase [Rubellimicrobium thermophilum DSM 16684]|uniref:Glutamine phosphoribosylpyrophosphate amidotransferase n=2 Tax=Rubellimicrobium TaxID=295418 RepID=S9SN41_9RHOB|nr:Glutamine phosphoribosylpyrophosphate amidotransferase [Rubellimicrobium thermophilum DSM 16684]